jgi:hypothetical protein
LVKDDAVALLLAKALFRLMQSLLEFVDVLLQLLDVGGGGRALDGIENLVGFAVEALAGDLALLGQFGDGPVGAEEGGRGAGKTPEGG